MHRRRFSRKHPSALLAATVAALAALWRRSATIQLDYATMRDGDRAGLALLRDLSAWIGIERDGGTTR
jgi:hypothetical protein